MVDEAPCWHLTVGRRPGRHRQAWTYDDYRDMPDDGGRYEIIQGTLYRMPKPNVHHQHVLGHLGMALHAWFAPSRGEVLCAPFDVELIPARGGTRATVIQPDVLLMLPGGALPRLIETRLIGPPDLAIEVTSPGTAAFDHREKLSVYGKAQLPELWIVDPLAHAIEVFHPVSKRMVLTAVAMPGQRIPSKLRRGWKPTVDEALGLRGCLRKADRGDGQYRRANARKAERSDAGSIVSGA